jgi:hypothetical protein
MRGVLPLLHSTKNCEVYGMPVGPMGMNQMLVACTASKKAVIVGTSRRPYLDVARNVYR